MQENSYRIHIRQGEFELDVEGDRAFVEAYVEAFLAAEDDLQPFQEAPPKRRANSKGPAKPKKLAPRKKAEKQAREKVSADRSALKTFMKGRKVESNKQRYLEYMRFWYSHGEKQVGDRHIQACYAADSLPMPPTGRQNFGSLRKEGLVQEGTQRGFWALTSAGLQLAASPAKRSRGPKAAAAKGAKPAGRKGAKPAGRKGAKPTGRKGAKPARKTRKKAVSRTVPPDKSQAKPKAPTKAAKKKAPRRRTPAKVPPKNVPEVAPTPEGV